MNCKFCCCSLRRRARPPWLFVALRWNQGRLGGFILSISGESHTEDDAPFVVSVVLSNSNSVDRVVFKTFGKAGVVVVVVVVVVAMLVVGAVQEPLEGAVDVIGPRFCFTGVVVGATGGNAMRIVVSFFFLAFASSSIRRLANVVAV
jgi:hypothetical protein